MMMTMMMTIPSAPYNQINKEKHLNVHKVGKSKEEADGQNISMAAGSVSLLHYFCPLMGIGELYKETGITLCRADLT